MNQLEPMRDFLHQFRSGNRAKVSLPVRLPLPKDCPFWTWWAHTPSRDDLAEFRDGWLPCICDTLTTFDGLPHKFVLNEKTPSRKRRGGSPIAKKNVSAEDRKGAR